MALGVCMCTSGPPAGGRCMACGMVGPTLPVPPANYPPQQPIVVIPPIQVGKTSVPTPTEDDIRRIIREEIKRAKEDDRG